MPSNSVLNHWINQVILGEADIVERTNGHEGVNEAYLKYEIGQQLSFGEQNTEVIMAKLKRSGLCQTNYSAAVGATVQNVWNMSLFDIVTNDDQEQFPPILFKVTTEKLGCD